MPSAFPSVSVFMPVYNHAAFLREVIESVLTQDYPNFCLMIGDDCSQDDSPAIIQEYAQKHPEKIRYYLNDRNMGITGNCNKLLALCDGEYVAFTAGDDLFLPGKLARQVPFMQQHPHCVASYTNARIFGDGVRASLYYGAFPRRHPYEIHNGNITPFIENRNFLAGCTIMARRDALPAGLYNSAIPVMSDWLFFTEVAARGDILYIDEVLSAYRRHLANATWRYTSIDDFEKTYELMLVKFPAYHRHLQAGRARLYVSYCFYYLIKGRHKDAVAMITKAKDAIVAGGLSAALFVMRSFFADCCRYAYRLINRSWRL